MSDWLKLDRFKINRPIAQTFNGVHFEVLVSPYDVPDAVKGYLEEASRKWVIEFKYSGADEPKSDEDLNPSTTLRVGRHSGRLYQIRTDVDSLPGAPVGLLLGVQAIAERLGGAIENYTAHPWRRGNYRLAGEVIKDRRDELFSALKPS